MKLHYFHGRGPLRTLVLQHEGRRVELHIKTVSDTIWALVAMSGDASGQPDRCRCQGPYRSAAQAEAVLRSTAGALLANGFEPQPRAHPVWTVMAQRLARDIRREGASHGGHYAFDPDQPEPIT